jgi:predicted P-loop ATPase
VFFGSTNADTYLKDDTGGRRFWPVRCGRIDVSAIERDRDQLWAEAVTLFNKGTSWWLTNDSDGAGLARNEQDQRYVGDPWEQSIAEYLEDKDSVSVHQILRIVIDKPQERWTQSDQNRVAACLRALGFTRKRGTQPPRHYYYERRPSSSQLP